MDDKKIEEIARDIRKDHSNLKNVPLEKILKEHLRESGLEKFVSSFNSPTAWITGVVSLWVDGFMPENQIINLVAGVSIGASIDAISQHIKSMTEEEPSQLEPVVKPQERDRLYSENTSNVVEKFTTGIIEELKEEGYKPPAIEQQRAAAVYRAAMRDPRLMMMIS